MADDAKDDGSGLRGGTEGGGSPTTLPGGPGPGGTNALNSGAGGAAHGGGRQTGAGVRNASKDDPEAILEGGTRHRGAGEVNGLAADAAGVPPPHPPRYPDETRTKPEDKPKP